MTLLGMDDRQLLAAYARDRSETAFAELLGLHLNWVYSVALRQVGDPHLAEDVVQSVFVLLARKAPDLRPGTPLNGWLFRATGHVAAHARRTELRRKLRESTACTMITDASSPDASEQLWQQLAPHLDQAVAALSEADRSAVLLRFYEKMPLRTVGERLGISEEAAKKRVSRALERLRTFLNRRGVKITGMGLAALLVENTVQTASAALAGAVVKFSLAAASTTATAGLPELARLTLRAWQAARVKLEVGLVAGSLALVFLAGMAGVRLAQNYAAPAFVLNAASPVTAIPGATIQPAPAPAAPAGNPAPQPFQKTGALTGVVVDQLGHPVAGAKVWGGFGSSPYAQDETDEVGQFALATLATPPYVTVQADGFAADQQEIDPSNAPGPLLFRLSPVRPLKIRLVDESGQGVTGVHPFLFRWWGGVSTMGQYLSQATDADGRVQWLTPPAGEFELQFGHSDFRYSRANKLVADGEEHLIVLHPTATVAGTVTDAESGAPVTSFRYVLGHAQPWNPSDQVPLWDLSVHPGVNGAYQAAIEEEQTPYMRIEADGYDILEAELPTTNGITAVRNFQLVRHNPATAIRGTVLLPDGRPAAGVEVALCTAQVGVRLNGTNFEPRAFGNVLRSEGTAFRLRTDAQGAFAFDPKPGAHTVVAAGAAGLGQARCFDYTQPLEIRLQPWGRIEGVVRTRNARWADRTLRWEPNGHLTSWQMLGFNPEGQSTRSDAAGKFTLEHVPPGDGRVVLEDGDSDTGTAPVLSDAVEVTPGETAQVQVGGVGHRVSGKLVAPPGVAIWSWPNQVTLAMLISVYDSYDLPKGLTGNAAEQWKLEFEDSDAGRAWSRTSWTYDFTVGADGSFTFPEVLPGKYRLLVDVAHGNPGSALGPATAHDYGSPPVAQGGMQFEVRAGTGNDAAPVALGEIVLTTGQ